jgi:hypothetical protein
VTAATEDEEVTCAADPVPTAYGMTEISPAVITNVRAAMRDESRHEGYALLEDAAHDTASNDPSLP